MPEPITFTVDSALLQELGERLVGRPHIALAELIKNGYDADASVVEVTVSSDYIEVADDGHGMDFDAFRDFWMRIGSPHKDRRRMSPGRRALTGSKGVGRLSAQFLADCLTLTTKAKGSEGIEAEVDWRRAVEAEDLTQAQALWRHVRPGRFPGDSNNGTRIVLRGLKQAWDAKALEQLARELWPLQPPYAREDGEVPFRIELSAQEDPEAQERFDRQMRAILRLWHARIIGEASRDEESSSGTLSVRVQFRDDTYEEAEWSIDRLRLSHVRFEIRVFALQNRQPHGIKVDEARQYLNRHGGVHVYDAGFHLPYYGAEVDWLNIELTHSHRVGVSPLLPEELQVKGGLTHLPTNSRLYGWVRVDTGREREIARQRDLPATDALAIQVSRDRLIDNEAYRQLQDAVRWSLDLYAMAQARREWSDKDHSVGDALPGRVVRVEEVLERHRGDVPESVFDDLRREIGNAVAAAETQAERAVRQTGLLGALATAGIAAIAAEHEAGRQISDLALIERRLRRAADRPGDNDDLVALADRLSGWLEQARGTRRLFSSLMEQEDREEVQRLYAREVIDRTAEQAALLLRGVSVETGEVAPSLRLPAGRYAEWSALLQNVLLNAANATLDSDRRVIAVRADAGRGRERLLIQDSGSGIDLRRQEELFEPFARAQEISAERRALGAGGTGLGLTIVRMIAANLGCSVGFVESDSSFNTAFEIAWRTE